MRTIHTSLATLATATLIALGTAGPATSVTAEARAATSTTTHERGIVLECTGRLAGKHVFTSLYENDAYVNVIQVVIGDDGTGASREVERGFLDDGQVRGSVRVDGRRALVTGTAHRVGERLPVHEEYDDAGQHITVDGYHRRLANDLVLTYAGRTRPLTCDTAFAFNLQVTREDVTQ
ncbi:MAG TPA: hypothetical protein VFT00_00725 [Nocardioides sp.]|nr:hypothetical protein [Nocardioides sp.]